MHKVNTSGEDKVFRHLFFLTYCFLRSGTTSAPFKIKSSDHFWGSHQLKLMATFYKELRI